MSRRLCAGLVSVVFSALSGCGEESDPITTIKLVALGDSITTATNVKGFGESPENSWVTGDSSELGVDSHHLRLQGESNVVVSVTNAANSGATSADLTNQVDEIIESSPTHVTLMIGANDACDWTADGFDTEVVSYITNIETEIQRLVAKDPALKILVVAIPDMKRMWQIGSQLSCSVIWGFAGVCSNLLGTAVTDEQRTAFQERIITANGKLEALASSYSSNVAYNAAVGELQFDAEHLSSLDCFHPSAAGQQLIAETTWDLSWYR